MERFWAKESGAADNLAPSSDSDTGTGMQGIPKKGETVQNPGEKKPGKNRAAKGFFNRYQTTGKVLTDFPNRVSIS